MSEGDEIKIVKRGEGYMIVEGLSPRPTRERLREQIAAEIASYPPEVQEKLKTRYSKCMLRPEYFGVLYVKDLAVETED